MMDNTTKVKLSQPLSKINREAKVGQTVAVRRGDYIDLKIIVDVVRLPDKVLIATNDGQTHRSSDCFFLTFDE